MGLRISDVVTLGAGSRGFRFENHKDRAEDQKQYDQGVTLEEGRFHRGSVAQRVFELLSHPTPDKLNEAAHSAGTAVAKQSTSSKVRKSAA